MRQHTKLLIVHLLALCFSFTTNGGSGDSTFADVVTVYPGPTTTVQWGDINSDDIAV